MSLIQTISEAGPEYALLGISSRLATRLCSFGERRLLSADASFVYVAKHESVHVLGVHPDML